MVDFDYTHLYQPIEFADFGKTDSKLGYDWNVGNILLSRVEKQKLLDKIPETKNDFRNCIKNEVHWGILNHLNVSLVGAQEESMSSYESLLGDSDNLQDAIDFAVNSALYISRRSGGPGFWRGNSILYNELKNPESVAYNLGRPDFKKRIVNCAFWEQIRTGGSEELEEILSQEAALLDEKFIDAGWKIFKINTNDTEMTEHYGFNFSSLSKGAMVNFAHFTKRLKEQKMDSRYEREFERMFIKDYVKALDNEDHWDIPYFEDSEKEQLKSLVK